MGRMPPLEHVQKMQYKYLVSVEVSVRVWRFMKGLNSMFVECALMCLSLQAYACYGKILSNPSYAGDREHFGKQRRRTTGKNRSNVGSSLLQQEGVVQRAG